MSRGISQALSRDKELKEEDKDAEDEEKRGPKCEGDYKNEEKRKSGARKKQGE